MTDHDFTLCRERPCKPEQHYSESPAQAKMRIVRAAKKEKEAKRYAKVISKAIEDYLEDEIGE